MDAAADARDRAEPAIHRIRSSAEIPLFGPRRRKRSLRLRDRQAERAAQVPEQAAHQRQQLDAPDAGPEQPLHRHRQWPGGGGVPDQSGWVAFALQRYGPGEGRSRATPQSNRGRPAPALCFVRSERPFSRCPRPRHRPGSHLSAGCGDRQARGQRSGVRKNPHGAPDPAISPSIRPSPGPMCATN